MRIDNPFWPLVKSTGVFPIPELIEINRIGFQPLISGLIRPRRPCITKCAISGYAVITETYLSDAAVTHAARPAYGMRWHVNSCHADTRAANSKHGRRQMRPMLRLTQQLQRRTRTVPKTWTVVLQTAFFHRYIHIRQRLNPLIEPSGVDFLNILSIWSMAFFWMKVLD